VYYIIIHLIYYKMRVYLLCYSYMFQIKKTSDPCPYSTNIHSVFVFDNIYIYIRIHFKKYIIERGKDTIQFASDPFPPLVIILLDVWEQKGSRFQRKLHISPCSTSCVAQTITWTKKLQFPSGVDLICCSFYHLFL
jgi:hypothetical protein